LKNSVPIGKAISIGYKVLVGNIMTYSNSTLLTVTFSFFCLLGGFNGNVKFIS